MARYLVQWFAPNGNVISNIYKGNLKDIKKISEVVAKRGYRIVIPKNSIVGDISKITVTGRKTAKLRKIL
jgi:hypothetical protein